MQESPTRIRMNIGYDGAGFTGWARQPGLRTVQGELESALATVFAKAGDAPPPLITVAGRTDVGVHATGQVAHVDLAPEQSRLLERPHRDAHGPTGVTALVRRLNGIAGDDVRVHSAEVAPTGFDARFAALWRRYEYRIADAGALHDPRRRGHTLWHPRPLDVDAMNAAARELLGLHDFAAYCKPREGATTIRTLQEYAWERDADGVLVARVRADAFCHSMVRALVGAAIAVGSGRMTPARPGELLAASVRGSEFAVVPALGLTLVEVGYPPDDELASRVELTRARRPALDPQRTERATDDRATSGGAPTPIDRIELID